MHTTRHLRLSVFSVFFLFLVVALTSCSKKEVRNDGDIIGGEMAEEEVYSESDGAALENQGEMAASDLSENLPGTTVSGLQTVYFDYDRYNLRTDTRSTLKANADYMTQNPSVIVQIEGHCDERGTNEYNLALGERRANAAKGYLVRLGVDPSRIEIISYGEERPSNPSSNESAWSENRRAEFVVLSQ